MSARATTGLVLALGAVLTAALAFEPRLRSAAFWQQLASPGKLSTAHADLTGDCAACHVPMQGPIAARCIVCHANDERLLQSQPTAFHASVSSCRECHPEHRGSGQLVSTMDHSALVAIGLKELMRSADPEQRQFADAIAGLGGGGASARGLALAVGEAALDCAACHATVDPHLGLFGSECSECHGTKAWAVTEYRHPAARSRDCAQCHQAPPSHYMMHFEMISAKVARKPHARVEQCYECHRITSWNDIPGIGRYKHH